MPETSEHIDTFIHRAESIIGENTLSRDSLDKILAELVALSARKEMWGAENYADPQGDSQQSRYLIHEHDDKTFALYLNVMRPGRRIPPHNHTTWACVAPVVGCEINRVYERTDDGSVAGKADLKLAKTVRVEGNTGIAMLADDIHSVEIPGTECIRHLHFYGKALETLSERVVFDIDAGTVKPMAMTVQTQR